MRDYEMTAIASPEVGDENVPTVIERIKQFVIDAGGEVTKVDNWGRRRLAYPIDGFRDGYYFVTKFQIAPSATLELERNVKLSEQIIRYMLIRVGE